MAVAFLREAEAVLKQGGYELDRKSGKSHGIWKHPDAERPAIHVPGTPRDPDHALIRLKRAVRVGSTPHIPQGLEADMTRTRQKHVPSERTLAQQLVQHAPAGLKRRAQAGNTGARASHTDLEKWLRKCLQSHGRIPNHDLLEAATELALTTSHLSHARVAVGAVTFREAIAPSPRDPSYTDFAARLPEGAVRLGRIAGSKNKSGRPAEPVTVLSMPTDPDEERGRRLDQGGLTEEQRLAAEETMRRSSELADREAAEIRERLAAGYAVGDAVVPVAAVQGENGNGKPAKTGMELAMELLVAEALAATHALTDDDIAMLRGTQENLKRIKSDLDGMAAGIAGVLRRVDQRQAEQKAAAA